MDVVTEVLGRIAGQERGLDKSGTMEKPGYYVPFVGLSGTGEPYSADAEVFRAAVVRAKLVFRRLVVSAKVATTNNGTNYWTINLKAATAGTLASVNTSAAAADTWVKLEDTTFTAASVLDSVEKQLVIDIVKTGAPGALSLAPGLYVI